MRARLNELGFVRAADDRIVTGAAAGLSRRLGIDPVIVRVAFGVLTLAAGAGVLAYAGLVLLSSDASPAVTRDEPRRSGLKPIVAVAFIVWGLLTILRDVGFWPGDGLVWPVSLAALGATVIYTRSEGGDNVRWGPLQALFSGRGTILRIAAGAALIVFGAGTFLASVDVLAAARVYTVPVLVAVSGLSLIFGPWLYRLGQQLAEERRERIRSQERSEMAAHLHDSVLQTLSLIQRSHDARSMASVARVQERELRAWLYGQAGLDHETLAGAIDAAAGRVEEMHQVSVETIVVGDAPIDERSRSLVHACKEAMQNAATHSGSDQVSVYVEVEAEAITAYVRDQGRGFDVGSVPEDRRGISDSIRARIHRNGGSSAIFSQPGEGTEVHLRMPRSRT